MFSRLKGKTAKAILAGTVAKGFPADLTRVAGRKLLMVLAADALKVLSCPPGNRLEVLTGNRRGQHSIRINDQWRICFRWQNNRAEEIEIVDYH